MPFSSSPEFFSKLLFHKILSGKLSGCQNGLDPDQDGPFVRPDFGPNCSQRLSADDKSCCLIIERKQEKLHRGFLCLYVPATSNKRRTM